MKRIFVLRHGKADRTHFDKDYNRVLKNKGIDDSNRMGDFLKKQSGGIDLIIASGALRAKQTADLVHAKIMGNTVLKYDDRLYDNGVNGMFEILKEMDDAVETVLFVGHNPTLESFISEMVSNGTLHVKLTTCGLALISIEIDQWAKIQPQHGTLEWVLKPKLL